MQAEKKARVEVRVSLGTRALFSQAAALQGRSMSEFMVLAGTKEAETAIARHRVLQLSLADQERFAAALIDPPPIAPALKRTAALHGELIEPS